MSGPPDRPTLVALLAEYDQCAPAAVGDRVDSLQLAWLLHAVEEEYQVELDLDDDQFEAMGTVDGAVRVLGEMLAADGR